MKYTLKSMSVVAFTLITFGWISGGANAAVLFSVNAIDANDLDVTITTPLEIAFNVTAGQSKFGFVFNDVFSAPQATNLSAAANNTVSLIYSGDMSSTTNTTDTASGTVASESIANTDLVITWNYLSVIEFSPGETLTAEIGTYTLDNFLVSGSVPNVGVSTAQIVSGGNGAALSAPIVVVPEPSTLILLGIASLVGIVFFRRRTQ